MVPYYQDSLVTIYHGDCREVLPLLAERPDGAVLTDPPYGIGKADWDRTFPLWWTTEAARIAPRLGLMPGVWNLLECPHTLGGLTYRWTLAARLTNGMTRGRMGFGNWIPCLIYSGGEEAASWCARFADWCDSQGIRRDDLNGACGVSDMGGWWASRLPHRAQIPTAAQWEKLRRAFNPPVAFDAGVFAASWGEPNGDCRDFAVGREVKPDHESPKPLAPTEWFLSRLATAWVLDPFVGSGTTLLAAKNINIPSVGIEISERHCETAARRLDQAVLPLGGVA